MTKTTRIPDTFAGQGAVAQHGGSLPVYRCNTCGSEVAWATSKRTGNKYLVNVLTGQAGQRYYVGNDFHPRGCAPVAQDPALVAEALRFAGHKVCARHGALEADEPRCVECEMEREEARRDLADTRRAAEHKMGRDRAVALSPLTLRNMSRSAR